MMNNINEIWQTGKSRKVALLGECMLEITQGDKLQLGFAGDTLNTAIYLARRLKGTTHQVEYMTALGDDPFSDQMLLDWQQEGICTDHVTRIEGKLPGIYWVKTDTQGERSFYYWRQNSAARDLLKVLPEAELFSVLRSFDMLYFSAISIAILDAKDKRSLLNVIANLQQQGVQIAMDTNYRPALWKSKKNARKWIKKYLQVTDIALVSFEDEQNLFSDKSIEDTALRVQGYSVREVVVKNGGATCLAVDSGNSHEIKPEKIHKQVDSTAAGDSFNAAYLAARIQGESIDHAVHQGHKLAAKVVQVMGAIIPL